MESENEFYVCLLSNASLQVYKNTLSAFSNLMSKPIKLSESWCVGLTEIAFNDFTKSGKLKRSLNEIYESGSDNESISYQDVELLDTPIKRIKRGAKSEVMEIFFKEMGGWRIFKKDIKKMTYKGNNINFGTLLRYLDKFTLEHDKKRVKLELIDAFNQTIDVDETNLKDSDGDDFIVHVYQGSNKSDNVILKLATYKNTKAFISHLISQIPKPKRKLKSLLNSVKTIFYGDFNTDRQKESKSEDSKLQIPFDELGVNISSDLQKLPKLPDGSINLEDIIDNFSENLFIQDNYDREKDLKETIKNVISDFIKDIDGDKAQARKLETDSSIKVNVPLSNTSTFPVLVDNKKYRNIEKFLADLYQQIPPVKRNKKAFVETLDNFFKPKQQLEILNQTKPEQPSKTPMAESMVASSSHELFYVYCDIIKPKYIGHIQSRYLKVIPVGAEKVIRFEHVEYCAIETTYIESISILITDGQGEKINFKESTTPTYIMLHFKKNKIV